MSYPVRYSTKCDNLVLSTIIKKVKQGSYFVKYLLTGLFLLSTVQILFAAEDSNTDNLSKRTNDIQAQVIELNRDLFL